MARYINEDEFVAWVKEHWCSDCNNDNGLRCRACWIDDAIDIVEEAPPADVAPKSEVALKVIRQVKNKVRKHKQNVVNPYEHIMLYLNELEKKYTEENK